MCRYVYAFHREVRGEKVFFKFPKLPAIVWYASIDQVAAMTEDQLRFQMAILVVAALQELIAARDDIPAGDNEKLVKADGFVSLSVQQAMKLELFKVYKENCKSVAAFARLINKEETSARRLLNLRHPSVVTEIETSMEALGKRIVHSWNVEVAGAPNHSALVAMLSVGQRGSM